MKEKISTGSNDRPKNETIAQSGPGMPDDSGPIIDVGTDDVARVRQKLGVDPASSSDEKPGRDLNSDVHHGGSADAPGAEEIAGADADEDTFD